MCVKDQELRKITDEL